jgi:hypothetical protein
MVCDKTHFEILTLAINLFSQICCSRCFSYSITRLIPLIVALPPSHEIWMYLDTKFHEMEGIQYVVN